MSNLSEEETKARFEICLACENFAIGRNIANVEMNFCQSSNVELNLITSDSEYTCPLEKW